nr:4Fe-4S dicluster domain-containing protein [Bacillota bacterium]
MEQYLKNFKNCLQKEIPFCAAECPFHIDIPDFIEKMKRGGFKAAFKTYRNAVGFPVIASNLCPEPCKSVCPRRETDSAIELLMLEQACVSFAGDKSPTDYNLPMKKKKIAIIGAGISGLSCALRLCMKKYEVEIFEGSGRIGGALWDLMDPDIFLKDIEEQFQHEKYTLHLNTPVRSTGELEGLGFDAVYAATGEEGEDFGLIPASDGNAPSDSDAVSSDGGAGRNQKYCALYGNAGWFAGGGLIGDEPVYAMANGLHMGTVIDNFLKTGNLLYPDNRQETKLCLDPAKLKYREPVTPADGTAFDEAEAKREAARCIECQCDFCRTYCDLTDFYNKWPLRIRDEIMATTLPGSADVKATPAKRLLSTCNQCGLCLETCPEDIDIGGLILAGRKSMHRQKKAPWVFHDFWLRDMDFANGEKACISKAPAKAGTGAELAPGTEAAPSMKPASGSACSYAFFPGCQLGASDPELVKRAYGYLLGKRPDTGLLLRCCGAPAEWSGDEEKFNGEVETVYKLWRELGKPTLILACPTCEKKFKTYMA